MTNQPQSIPTEHGPSPRQSFYQEMGIGTLLAALTLLTFFPALSCDFVNLDDPKYVSENPHVAGGLSGQGLIYAWTTFDVGNWIPLTWMSYELDATLFGIRARAFHAVNLAWHLANVLLLYATLRRMTASSKASAVVAALFAVHPLHVESVVWISERKDVLSTSALLISLLLYERYAARPTFGRMAWICLSMALGLLAKSMLVTMPCLLLLLDYWPLNRIAVGHTAGEDGSKYPIRNVWQLLLEKLPLGALSIVAGIVTILAQGTSSALISRTSLPLVQRLMHANTGYGWYLWKTVWPSDLCPFYPLPVQGPPILLSGSIALLLTGITFYVIINRAQRHLAFGWLWFVIALLPVIGLIQVGGQAYADRYAYIPHIGLFVMLVWEAQRWQAKYPGLRYSGTLGAALVVTLFATVSYRQTMVWRNSETLWSHALEKYPDNYGAHLMMGTFRADNRDWDAAEKHFQQALLQRPNFQLAIVQLGDIAKEREDRALAAEYYAWALRINPEDLETSRRLRDLGPVTKASTARSTTVELSQAAIDSNRRGLVFARRGEMQTALGHFEKALEQEPDYADAHNNLALTLQQLGRLDDSRTHFLRAVEQAPEDPDFHVNLAAVLALQKDWTGACTHYEAALRIRPQDAEAKMQLEHVRKWMEQPK